MIGTALAILLKVKGCDWVLHIVSDCQGTFWGTLAVYRVALGMILYHAFLTVVLIKLVNQDDARWMIHNQLWPIKSLIWICSLIGVFFISAESIALFWIPSRKF